jgi:cystathionine gamma-lyase
MDALKKSLNPKTKMLFLESPANPTMRVFDVKKISGIVHDYNKEILVLIDNSCLTLYFQRLLPLGCDIVHYSLSKYANGHGDLVGGALVTNSDKLAEQMRRNQHVIGAVPSPFDCFLVARGLKTLPVRMRELMRTSIKVAEYLQKHPKVEHVAHPGLATDPGHALAKKQSSGHSGLVAFRVKGGKDSAVKFVKGLKLFQYAASFGGCESLVQIPIMLTHAEMPKEHREKLGITENFVRLNVGLESVEDLIADLEQAFKTI